MVKTKEELYARHRAYQKTEHALALRRERDRAYHKTPEYRAKLAIRRSQPEYKEKIRLAQKRYRSTPEYKLWKKAYRNSQKAKDARRNQLLQKNFGISLDEYNRRLSEQGGVCAICLQPEQFQVHAVPHALAVDHCHKTGKVRGLLCRDCNQGLGQFRDNIQNIKRAAQYLLQ